LASAPNLQVLAFLAGYLNNLTPGLQLHLDQLIVRAFTSRIELLEVDFPRIEQAVAGDFFKRIYSYRVSADPALEGLHQTEGRIVSYSRIKGEMKDRIGPSIRIENLRGSRATEEGDKEKARGKSYNCSHILLFQLKTDTETEKSSHIESELPGSWGGPVVSVNGNLDQGDEVNLWRRVIDQRRSNP